MRKAWLRSITAALCVMGLIAPSVMAAPVDMAVRHRNAKTPAQAAAPAQTAATWQAAAPRPSEQISATKHPWQYLKAAISESPLGSKSAPTHTANAVVPPARPLNDSIALNTPVGPPTPQFLISTAQLCERQHDIEHARQHFQQALAIWPGHVEVLRAAARMEDRQGNLPLAESLYQQAVTSNPMHAGALNDLGLCLAREGKLEASAAAIEQAINLDPAKPLFRNNAATVLVEMRQDQRALAHLSTVHGSAEANYNLGQLLVQRGRPADAVSYFQVALQQNPQMQQAQIALAQVQGGTLAETACNPTYTQAPAAQQVAPAVTPVSAPQYNPQVGPQLMKYPATVGATQVGVAPQMQPQYVPPVAQLPGAMQR